MANRIGLAFDGATSYIKLPLSVSSGKSIFSFSVDFSTTDLSTANDSWDCPMIFGNDRYGVLDFGVHTSAGKIVLDSGISDNTANASKGFTRNTQDYTDYYTDVQVADGKKHRIVITCDGTLISCYIDSIKMEKQISTGGKSLENIPFVIGATFPGTRGIKYWKNTIYEIKVYNRGLTDSEAINIESVSNEILWYKPDSDDFSNKYLTDKSGNSNDSDAFVGTVTAETYLGNTSGNADMSLIIINSSYSLGNADIFRNVASSFSGNTDILRDVHFSMSESGNTDMNRTAKTSYSGNADTIYLRRLMSAGSNDMTRIVKSINSINADTRRIIPLIISDMTASGIRSISITLSEHTLSDTLQIDTINSLNVKDAISGKLLDYSYNMSVESTSQQDIIQTVQGMYDVDQLLYTPFHYYPPDENTAAAHARKIASAMGKSLNISIDDFVPSNNYAGTGATYHNIISGIFGWTSRLPRRQINVFIRDNVLNVIQRGHESSVVDISSYSHSRPKFERKIVRSVWSGDNGRSSAMEMNVTIEPIPFTGTIEFADSANTYRDGLLVSARHTGESTEYRYSDEFLVEKITTRSDGSVITTDYEYAATDNDKFLAMETETTVDKKGNKSVQITRHQPIGHGWYGTTVEVDGEYKSSSLSQGKTGGRASKYTIDQSNLSFGANWPNGDGISGGTSLIDTEFPVTGTDMLKKLTSEIEWMNQRTEENVSVEITPAVIAGVCSLQHIIDFTERVKLDGNEYYLVSNAVTQDPHTIKQSLKLVRWY